MPTPPVFFADTLAVAALQRLEVAIAAAPVGAPLHDVYVPPSRWQEIPDGTLAALVVFSSGERGDGISKQLPEFEVTDTINIVGELALGREDGVDLDQAAGRMVRAILETLLEDSSFLALFGWVESVNVEKNEASTGREGTRFDALSFRIQLELAGSQTQYTPQIPAAATPLQTVDVQATVGAVVVESQNPLPQ